jgi:hypothetical protein
MLYGITNRLPGVVVTAIHQAAVLGSTYAIFSLLAACVRSLLEPDLTS